MVVANQILTRIQISISISSDHLELDTHVTLGWISYQHRYPIQGKEYRCIMRLLLNVYRLGNERCILCEWNVSNSIEHIFFECPHVSEVRERLWSNVIDNCPDAMAMEMYRMNTAQRSKFILNGFFCNYTQEWHMLYCTVAKFIYVIYMSYYNATLE